MSDTAVLDAGFHDETNEVDPAIARSWLLVNAAHPDRFNAALASRADQLVLDVEDAVDPAVKPSARAAVVHWLSDPMNRAWVRINDRSSAFWSDDVDALKGLPGLRGVMLAKTEASSCALKARQQCSSALRGNSASRSISSQSSTRRSARHRRTSLGLSTSSRTLMLAAA